LFFAEQRAHDDYIGGLQRIFEMAKLINFPGREGIQIKYEIYQEREVDDDPSDTDQASDTEPEDTAQPTGQDKHRRNLRPPKSTPQGQLEILKSRLRVLDLALADNFTIEEAHANRVELAGIVHELYIEPETGTAKLNVATAAKLVDLFFLDMFGREGLRRLGGICRALQTGTDTTAEARYGNKAALLAEDGDIHKDLRELFQRYARASVYVTMRSAIRDILFNINHLLLLEWYDKIQSDKWRSHREIDDFLTAAGYPTSHGVSMASRILSYVTVKIGIKSKATLSSRFSETRGVQAMVTAFKGQGVLFLLPANFRRS
jgi:hypothetical protein